MKPTHFLILLTAAYLSSSYAADKVNGEQPRAAKELPQPNVLDLTPENFCLGLPNALAISKQNFTIEANALCQGQAPTQLFRELLANPYLGGDRPNRFLEEIPSSEVVTGNNIQIFVAYAMKVPRKAVDALLAEEGFVKVPYRQEILNITSDFLPPPKNDGEADIAFSVEQRTVVTHERVMFNDLSRHELRTYRLHPNNFDFLLAVRTLAAPSEQFKKAVVLKGLIADSEAPTNSTYLVTIFNFIMNSRDEPDSNIAEGVEETFLEFIERDMQNIFLAHSQGQ